MGTRRDGETERTQDGRRRGMAWARLAFARFCTALLGGRRATTTSGLGPYPFAKMDLGKPQNTSTGTGPEGDGGRGAGKLDAGTRGDISLAQSPLLPSERGPILCDLAVGWLVKRPQSGSLPAGRSWPLGKGRDAAGVEAFSGRKMGSSNRPPSES